MDSKPAKISAFVKASLGLMLTAIVDFLVSYSTAYWATWVAPHQQKYGGYGLWKLWRCAMDPEQHRNSRDVMVTKGFGLSEQVMKEKLGCEIRMADTSFPGWYVASQVLQTLGLAALVTAIVLICVYMFVPRWTSNQAFLKSIITVSYLAGIFTTVSLFVFGFKVAEEVQEMQVKDWALSWSFSLSCTACFLIQIAASVLVSESKRQCSCETRDVVENEEEILPVASAGYQNESDDEELLLSEPELELSNVVTS